MSFWWVSSEVVEGELYIHLNLYPDFMISFFFGLVTDVWSKTLQNYISDLTNWRNKICRNQTVTHPSCRFFESTTPGSVPRTQNNFCTKQVVDHLHTKWFTVNFSWAGLAHLAHAQPSELENLSFILGGFSCLLLQLSSIYVVVALPALLSWQNILC